MMRAFFIAVALLLLPLPALAAGVTVSPGAPSPLLTRSALTDPAACAQSAWTINPSTGSDSAAGTSAAPLRTAQELAHRRTGCVVNSGVTVTVAGSLGAADWPTFPAIGPSGYEVWSCSAAATTLRTGTLTGATAATSSAAATASDSTANFSTACSGGSCAGYRLRVTSGARAGAIAWVAYVVSTTQIRLSGPVIDPFVSGPTSATSPPGYASLATAAITAGDPYVLEQLPLLRTPSFGPISGDTTTQATHLVVDSCAFSNVVQYPTYASGVVINDVAEPYNGVVAAADVIGSYAGFMTGGVYHASLFDDFFQVNGPLQTYAYDSAFLGDAALNGVVIWGASVLQESCGAPCAYAGGFSAVESGASVTINGLVQPSGGPTVIQPGAAMFLQASYGLGGYGSNGVCVHVQTGGSLVSSVGYTCGDGGAVNLGGTVYSWTVVTAGGALVNKGATAGNAN